MQIRINTADDTYTNGPPRGPDPAARRARRGVAAAGERDRRAGADPDRAAVRRRHPAGGPGGGREAAERAVDPGRHGAGGGTGHPDADRRSATRRSTPTCCSTRWRRCATPGAEVIEVNDTGPGGRIDLVRHRRARAGRSTASRSAGRSPSRSSATRTAWRRPPGSAAASSREITGPQIGGQVQIDRLDRVVDRVLARHRRESVRSASIAAAHAALTPRASSIARRITCRTIPRT